MKLKKWHKPRSLRLAPAMMLLGIAICAQPHAEEDNENWYQVEMLIFKRAPVAPENEAWPKNLALAYPPNIQFLIEPQDEDDLAETVANIETADSTQTVPTDTLKPTEEQPFVVFDGDQFFIENAASAIRRERGLNVLFHKTWAQPMQSQEQAPAIIIRGGETFGEFSELSGTVTISLSRYLHIFTDLWLAEFEANYGQENYHWPKIPLPPQPITNDMLSDTQITAGSENLSILGGPSRDGFNLNLNATTLTTNSGDNQLNEWSSLASQPYLVKHITTLNQKRRMRSNELHYIDHPRMGILIKIIAYTPAHLQPDEPRTN